MIRKGNERGAAWHGRGPRPRMPVTNIFSLVFVSYHHRGHRTSRRTRDEEESAQRYRHEADPVSPSLTYVGSGRRRGTGPVREVVLSNGTEVEVDSAPQQKVPFPSDTKSELLATEVGTAALRNFRISDLLAT